MPSLQARMIAKNVHGHANQDPKEIAEFVDILLQDPPRTILEVGMAFGGTAQAWLEAATDDALLIGVDLDLKPVHYQSRAGQSVVLIEGNSRHANTCLEVRRALGYPTDYGALEGGRKVDLLFIDGEHTEEAVRGDFCAYWPYVRKGGIVAFHDVAGNDGVKAFWNGIGMEKHLIHNARESRYCMGIGWLRTQ